MTPRLRRLPRRLVAQAGALLAFGVLCAAPGLARATSLWEVTVAVRVSDTEGKPVELDVALPPETEHQRISNVEVFDRGMESDIVLGAAPKVVFRGRPGSDRRVSVTFRLQRSPRRSRVPPVQPAVDPPRLALDALRPASLFPSRSILVREFLETHVTPKLQESDVDMMRAIYAVTREQLPHNRDGKSLPLDVLRRGFGLYIGLERVFTTCLRSAGIPARFVEGIDLGSSTRRKRTFWTEVWSDGEWYPVSVSRGWMGRLPNDVVALAFDGGRAVRSHGAGVVDYSVVARPLPESDAATAEGGVDLDAR